MLIRQITPSGEYESTMFYDPFRHFHDFDGVTAHGSMFCGSLIPSSMRMWLVEARAIGRGHHEAGRQRSSDWPQQTLTPEEKNSRAEDWVLCVMCERQI